MTALLVLAAAVLGPILATALWSLLRPSTPFRARTVCKLYLTLLFGFFGLYAHLMHPHLVVELIPPFFPLRTFLSVASGVVELAFAVLIWTPLARPTSWAVIVYLALVLPFNIYGWTVPTNVPSYANAPLYLWLRVPMQAVFIAFAYLAGRRETPLA
jgi:uncharacterized membrane protein